MTLKCYKFEFCVISKIWEATTAKRTKLDYYWQGQDWSPLKLTLIWAFLR